MILTYTKELIANNIPIKGVGLVKYGVVFKMEVLLIFILINAFPMLSLSECFVSPSVFLYLDHFY